MYPLVTFEFSVKIEMVLDRYLIILTINEFFGGNMCVMGGRHHKLRTLFHFLKKFIDGVKFLLGVCILCSRMKHSTHTLHLVSYLVLKLVFMSCDHLPITEVFLANMVTFNRQLKLV